jgi:hypothetical protein
LLRQTAVDNWIARRKWSLEYIVEAAAAEQQQHHQHIQEGPAVLSAFFRQRGSPVFGPFYDPARPMHQLDGVKRINPYEENVALFLDEVVAKLSQPVGSTNEFHMLSQSLSAISPALWADIEPMDDFILYPDRHSVNVWLGQPGATTPCHYDGYSNLYAHLQGAKRFYLLPSARWRESYAYPLLHPSYGQCQINLTAPDQTAYPASRPLHEQPDALIADLQPGDLLYLPPFWIHEVVTVAPSVSVNFWSDIPQTKISEQVAQHPIPGLQIASFSGVVADSAATLWPDDSTRLTLRELAQPPARVILGAYVLLSALAAAVDFDEQRLRQTVFDTAAFRYGPLMGESGPLLSLHEQEDVHAVRGAMRSLFCWWHCCVPSTVHNTPLKLDDCCCFCCSSSPGRHVLPPSPRILAVRSHDERPRSGTGIPAAAAWRRSSTRGAPGALPRASRASACRARERRPQCRHLASELR